MALSLLRRCPLLAVRQSQMRLTTPVLRLSPSVFRLMSTEAPKGTDQNNIKKEEPIILPKRKNPFHNTTPVSWKMLGVAVVTFGIILQVFWSLKKRRKDEITQKKAQSIGKAAIGGDFELVDMSNKPVTLKDFRGQWLLIYFGFTHCPDICPEELEKMTAIVDMIDKSKTVSPVQPLFISVDPERDTPELISKYTADFSPRLKGLTGTVEQIKDICKKYRIYYSAGPKEDGDYIVDHTIIMYLLNPNGEFLQYYGRNKTAVEVTKDILFHMSTFNES